uniref:Nerve growth factor-related domain-containing protein n=1 Tax=Varanus komodoensis TaxID=61221 RepID=A0A8D2KRS2_VARKO
MDHCTRPVYSENITTLFCSILALIAFVSLPVQVPAMLSLLLAVLTPVLWTTHAMPLTVVPYTANVFYTESPLRKWEFISPHVAVSRQEPTVQPSSEDFPSQSSQTACDMITTWVTDKHTAVNIRGRNVMVASEILTPHGRYRQYFFETKCNPNGGTRDGCRGVDLRYWNSTCSTAQSFVKALTMDSPNTVRWEWIKIDTSCICTITTGRQAYRL